MHLSSKAMEGAEFHALSSSPGSRLRLRHSERLGCWREASSALATPSTSWGQGHSSNCPCQLARNPALEAPGPHNCLTVMQGPNLPLPQHGVAYRGSGS